MPDRLLVMLSNHAIAEVAHHMALIPLGWLTYRNSRKASCDAAYWWIAVAFGVSWVADSAAHWSPPSFVSHLYPVTQVAIIGAVLLPSRKEALGLLIVLTLVGCIALILPPMASNDVFLHTVAWLSVLVVASPAVFAQLRIAFSVYFGAGLIAWLVYTASPSAWGWYAIQGARLAGLVLFCWAVQCERPTLRVVRGTA